MPWPDDPFASPDPSVYVAKEKPAAPTALKGTSHEVLDWVGDSKERAQLALDAEHDSQKPRKGLVEELVEILGK